MTCEETETETEEAWRLMAIDQEAIDAAIVDNITGPAEMATDRSSMKMHDPLAQLEAKRKLLADEAAAVPGRGLRFSKQIPPGTV